MKKLLLAIVAAYIVLMLTNYLVHEVWLMSDYAAIPASHRSTAGIMHRFWAMAVGQFFLRRSSLTSIRAAQKKPWLVQGIRYGILIAFLTVVPTALGEYVVYIVPYQLAIKWMIAGGIQMIILGLIVAGSSANRRLEGAAEHTPIVFCAFWRFCLVRAAIVGDAHCLAHLAIHHAVRNNRRARIRLGFAGHGVTRTRRIVLNRTHNHSRTISGV